MGPKCNENDDLNEGLAEEGEGEEEGGLETCHAGCPRGCPDPENANCPFSAGCPNFAAGTTFFLTLVCLFEWTPFTKEGKWVSHYSLGVLPHVLGLALVTPPTRSYRRTPSMPGLEQTFL